ncbi:hypothetical protein B0T26DRAFT_369838 [Lasiosphaeria miniovina]|uniref:Uncharacterized protein n=1 Tax=Lasiosphaeria miniovina TaxID=1954250 RepID=A0AA40ADB7_9PEZI|nr:uncharacterized protein B0T26DRAFT_369838 [Lasiosphaeria miniovina]KAK0713730.1 hypothetical protein B0T26DRAFT_369838 [Lasiosphaeria miniovina]
MKINHPTSQDSNPSLKTRLLQQQGHLLEYCLAPLCTLPRPPLHTASPPSAHCLTPSSLHDAAYVSRENESTSTASRRPVVVCRLATIPSPSHARQDRQAGTDRAASQQPHNNLTATSQQPR